MRTRDTSTNMNKSYCFRLNFFHDKYPFSWPLATSCSLFLFFFISSPSPLALPLNLHSHPSFILLLKLLPALIPNPPSLHPLRYITRFLTEHCHRPNCINLRLLRFARSGHSSAINLSRWYNEFTPILCKYLRTIRTAYVSLSIPKETNPTQQAYRAPAQNWDSPGSEGVINTNR